MSGSHHRSAALGLMLAILTAVLLPAPAGAQVFGDVIRGAIDRNCRSLGVPFGEAVSTVEALGFGRNLATLCASGTEAASTSGSELTTGALPDQVLFGLTDDQRRLGRRMRERTSGLSFYAAGDYEYFDKDVTRFEPGYRSDTYGGTIGGDYAVTRSLLAGLAFKYAHTSGRFFQDGGTFDTDAYSVLLYASLHPLTNLFVDLVGGYTRKEYDIERRINFSVIRSQAPDVLVSRQGTAVSSTGGDEWQVSASSGYDFSLGPVTVGPRLGIHYRHTTIDKFKERGRNPVGCTTFPPDPPDFAGSTTCSQLTGTGLELIFDRQTEESLRTTAGVFASLALSLGFGVLVPQATVEYVHEFLDDQRSIAFRFAEDNAFRTKFRFQTDPPDRDYLNAGVGLVLVLPRGVTPYVNYTGLFGYSDQHRHAVTVGVRLEF
jgi:uncharacterized protein YhjY with autotransporter beta-barrel domain